LEPSENDVWTCVSARSQTPLLTQGISRVIAAPVTACSSLRGALHPSATRRAIARTQPQHECDLMTAID
jgi:hypothetical protein